MVDYLYQLDYDESANRRNRSDSDASLNVGPASPVANNVKFFENLNRADERPPEIESPPVEADLVPCDAIEDPQIAEKEDSWIYTPKKDKKKPKKKIKTVLYRNTPLRLRKDGQDVNDNRLTINTLMYAMADKYAIEDLKLLAKTKFENAAADDWETSAFAHAAGLALETTPPTDNGLREVVVKTLNEHRGLMDYEEIQNLLDSGNGLAWRLLQVVLRDVDPLRVN